MTLRVLEPGLYTLVVDFGRPNYRSLGVPVGGAADRLALALGNALVGNPPDAAALEISLRGPTLQADCELACVVYGAPFELSSDRQPLKVGKTFTLHVGEVLRIGGTPRMMRAYLCVRGGFLGKTVLGSRSSLEPLRAGAELECVSSSTHGRFVTIAEDWNHFWGQTYLAPPWETSLRVLDGPQAHWFDPAEFDHFNWERPVEFRITAASNRMGIRLQGEPLHFSDQELVSEPVCPGSVQVTRDGQCIILGVDGQTIGGYPKVAQVITTDLDKLGQLRPGAKVIFSRVDLESAEALHRRKQVDLYQWIIRLRTSLPSGSIDEVRTV